MLKDKYIWLLLPYKISHLKSSSAWYFESTISCVFPHMNFLGIYGVIFVQPWYVFRVVQFKLDKQIKSTLKFLLFYVQDLFLGNTFIINIVTTYAYSTKTNQIQCWLHLFKCCLTLILKSNESTGQEHSRKDMKATIS